MSLHLTFLGVNLYKKTKINIFLRWLNKWRLKGPKSLFKYGEERSIMCNCTHEEKIDFESFTQNGCCSNQPHPFEI